MNRGLNILNSILQRFAGDLAKHISYELEKFLDYEKSRLDSILWFYIFIGFLYYYQETHTIGFCFIWAYPLSMDHGGQPA